MRISDWSSDVCSSDLECRSSGKGQCGREFRHDKGSLDHANIAFEFKRISLCIHPSYNERSKPSQRRRGRVRQSRQLKVLNACRSEEHTSELQSLMRISYAVFCLTKKNTNIQETNTHTITTH